MYLGIPTAEWSDSDITPQSLFLKIAGKIFATLFFFFTAYICIVQFFFLIYLFLQVECCRLSG